MHGRAKSVRLYLRIENIIGQWAEPRAADEIGEPAQIHRCATHNGDPDTGAAHGRRGVQRRVVAVLPPDALEAIETIEPSALFLSLLNRSRSSAFENTKAVRIRVALIGRDIVAFQFIPLAVIVGREPGIARNLGMHESQVEAIGAG